jgi:hypothetical protein
MNLSRAEIEAAAMALRRDARRSIRADVRLSTAKPRAELGRLLDAAAANVRTDGLYRLPLIVRLRRQIAAGTYRIPAETITEQLLGRLLAGALAI